MIDLPGCATLRSARRVGCQSSTIDVPALMVAASHTHTSHATRRVADGARLPRRVVARGFDDDIAAEGVVADDEDARHTAPGELADDSVAFTQGVG